MNLDINSIINKKEVGETLSKEEIEFIVFGYHENKISDAQILDFFRLINEDNFNYTETYSLANAIALTGEMLNVAGDNQIVVDKHSAGMVSDPTTLIFMSVLASLGIKNVKVLSRGYGDYGSSLDRFKVFKNFDAKTSKKGFIENLNFIGAGLIEDVGQIAPVDKKLYKLRRENGLTSVPLVASSILAKKIATGANVLVFDVKAGEGAIYPSNNYASTLARYLVNSAKLAGFKTASVVTNLDQPLGSSFGPRAEIEEAINVLRYEKSSFDAKLLDVARELVIIALMLARKGLTRPEASNLFDQAIESGRALDKFREIISAYGGIYEDYKHSAQILLEGTTISYLTASTDGYISNIILKDLINAYKSFSDKDDGSFDKNAGIVLMVREGSKVKKGDKIARLFYSIDNYNFAPSTALIRDCIVISRFKPRVKKVFYKIVV